MREGWEIRKLGDVCDLYQPKTISTDMLVSDGKYLVYGANGIIGRYNEYNHEQPEVLMTCRGATCGSINISKPFSWINGNAMVVHPKQNKIGQSFLKYLLQSIDLSCVITGAAQPQITRQSLKPVKVVVPPIAEQEKIVAELNCLTSIIEKKKQQLEELDKLAQSIFYDMFGDPVTNEKGWEVKEISSLFDVGSSKRVFEAQWRDKGVPFFRAREIVRLAKGEPIEDPIFVEEALYKEYSVKYGVPRPNDMMITGVGTLGVCYIVKADDRFYFKDGNILWFKQKGLCETRFIKEQYATDYVMNQIKGNANIVTVGTYTITNANKTKVIVPPLELQKHFVNRLEAIDRQKELVKRSIVETETLFNSRMDFWFNN